MIPLARLRALVIEYLGDGLSGATPERVRALLDRVQLETAEKPPPGQPWVIDGEAQTYEEIIRGCFWSALHRPPEEAVVHLWLLAAEAYLAGEQ